MLKRLLICLALCPLPAFADECIGTSELQTCFDAYGNRYTVQKFGGMTFIEGRDDSTGETWSQSSVAVGNSVVHEGSASDGSNWQMTERDLGAGYLERTGTETDGSLFRWVCNWLGECE